MATKKVVTFIKQYFFILALAATFVGFSAFKYAERLVDPTNGWYGVTLAPNGDPEELEDLQIGNPIPTPPATDSTSCAQNLNDGRMCAIELTFASGAEKPETVAEAESDNLVTITNEAEQPQDEN